jgi:hypothetical protein
MANLWWICGELWFFDGRFLGLGSFPVLEDLFFGVSRFGNDGGVGLEDEAMDGADGGVG